MVGTVPLTGSEPPAAVQAEVRRSRVLARFGHVSADLHPAPLRLFLDQARLADVFAEAGFTHWRLAEQTFNLILEARA
jgi:hypothetical protein